MTDTPLNTGASAAGELSLTVREAAQRLIDWIPTGGIRVYASDLIVRDLVAALSTPATDAGEVERPYLADRFQWAAPGDQQEDAWLVRFCDKDCGEAIFTGPDAEREAWEYWNRYAPSYNLYVFRLASLSSASHSAAGEERERPGFAAGLIHEPGTDPDDETVAGHVICHCSEDDGVPDVGVSIGLGGGKALWLGELLRRDGGDIGIIVHGPNGQRLTAVLWPECEWQDAADLLRHHVAPALTALAAPTDARAVPDEVVR